MEIQVLQHNIIRKLHFALLSYNFLTINHCYGVLEQVILWKKLHCLPGFTKLKPVPKRFGGIFDYSSKEQRLKDIETLLQQPDVWDDLDKSQSLNRERITIEKQLKPIIDLLIRTEDSLELAEIAISEEDEDTFEDLVAETQQLQTLANQLEFQLMFSGKMDVANAFVDVTPGSGGTESQDWAQMLVDMYKHWAQKHKYKVELIDCTAGAVAGIKGATLKICGDYVYGWLRTESGIHRLVRKSPFDSGARRHTSFASVFVYPEVEDQVEIEIDPGDLRIDTYRSSGAGGQHVNRTDSAVRITHFPSGIVVQCQNERSQHRNKAEAMSMLRAKLYTREEQKRADEKQALEKAKPDISWGNQIRSYVLDQSRIKDLRTNTETSSIASVLEGDIDMFLEASLKAGA